MGRFINVDSYASTGDELLGTNMFAYCGNNPVNMSDPTGEIGWLVATILVLCMAGRIIAGATSNERLYDCSRLEKNEFGIETDDEIKEGDETAS